MIVLIITSLAVALLMLVRREKSINAVDNQMLALAMTNESSPPAEPEEVIVFNCVSGNPAKLCYCFKLEEGDSLTLGRTYQFRLMSGSHEAKITKIEKTPVGYRVFVEPFKGKPLEKIHDWVELNNAENKK